MRTYKKVVKEVRVPDGVKCDICGNEENNMDSVKMQHNDWGNDSVDSYESVDYCSPKCYKKALQNFLCDEDFIGSTTAEFNGINIKLWNEIMNEK